MLISSSGAPGERRPAPGHGVLRAIPRRTWIHRLSILSIALAGSMFAASRTYALSFAEAREIAEQQSPRVSAQRLQIDAVESAQKAAGTLPDPKLSVGLENLPISGMDRWSLTRESMTGQRLALMQEVPNQAKRAAKVASAQARVERERAALVLQRLQIRQELGLAWIAAQAVEQREQLLTELLAENQRRQDSLPARVAGGSAQAGDLLAAQHEAQSESRGDWSWEIAYSRRDRRWGDMVSFQVTFDLPWQKDRRQTPMIQAKQRELERLEAEQEDVARRHLQELDDSAAELQALDSQIERLKSTGLQLAQGRAELALGNYRAAKGDLGAVLGARAQVLETRLRLIDLQAQRDGVTTRLNSLIAD